MNIAQRLGLDTEVFCRMVVTTKMLFSNVLGHAAELQYEKHLKSKGIEFIKAPTDKHYDYIVNGLREQVKRFESASTNNSVIGANLTKTHGNRIGEGGFYNRSDFDVLVLYDVGLIRLITIPVVDILTNPKFLDRLPGKVILKRDENLQLSEFEADFLRAMKEPNAAFPPAIEALRIKYNFTYTELLQKTCNLSLNDIDLLFCDDNFRLVTGAKGFAAEEHLNLLLEEKGIPYTQVKNMYSKADHLVGLQKLEVQVKITHERSTRDTAWGLKTHKSHGSGVGELHRSDSFDILALFVGFEIDPSYSPYIPVKTERNFVFVPIVHLGEHPKFPGYLNRVSKIKREGLIINDLTLFQQA